MLESLFTAIQSFSPVMQQAILYSFYMASGRRSADYASRRDLSAACADRRNYAAIRAEEYFSTGAGHYNTLRTVAMLTGASAKEIHVATRAADNMVNAEEGYISINGVNFGLLF